MTCCYTDEQGDCDNRRLGALPMCERHLRYTFRAALVDGAMPRDVFKIICEDAVEALGVGMRYREMAMNSHIAADRRQAEQAATEKRERVGVVYYVRLTGDRVKIGWTRDLANRMAIFRARPEDVLATEPGGMALEAKRHRQFADCRIGRTEEFTVSEALMAHVARLR